MGMYTGLRVKVTVKEQYRKMVEEINNGASWQDFVERFPFLKDYATQDRAEFIPRGALAYMPDSWETGYYPNEVATDGFDRKIDLETGYWTFQCSLKNRSYEIEQFFLEVLPVIISSSDHIEYFYEEQTEGIMYEFSNGKILKK